MRHCMALPLTSEDAKGEKEEGKEGRPFHLAVISSLVIHQTKLSFATLTIPKNQEMSPQKIKGHNVRETGLDEIRPIYSAIETLGWLGLSGLKCKLQVCQ